MGKANIFVLDCTEHPKNFFQMHRKRTSPRLVPVWLCSIWPSSHQTCLASFLTLLNRPSDKSVSRLGQQSEAGQVHRI